MTRTLLIVLTLFLATAAQAQEWRYFAGGTATRWTARGDHGHTEDCRTRECDRSDWERGNLDSSIGYRFGADRRVLGNERNRAIAGADLAVVTTEYNLSQRDFWVIIPTVTGGYETRRENFALGVLGGFGAAFTDDGRSHTSRSAEARLDLLANDDAGLRLGFRRTYVGTARLREIAVLINVSGLGEHETSPWHYEFSFGASEPGGGPGRNLSLGHAPVQKNALYRLRDGRGDAIGLTWTGSAHESRLRSEFYGVSGNIRGKTIPSIGVTWDRRVRVTDRLTVRVGGGAELADWSDDHGLLVHRASVLEQGLDAAAVAAAAGSLRTSKGVRIVLSFDQLYWLGSGLGERRIVAGAGVRL
jgi:hypothetical protein